MASIRQIADCIGLAEDFGIVRGFFGYTGGAPETLSLKAQVNRLYGPHIHVNLIRVGFELFSEWDNLEIDNALHFMRRTYETVNIGIGRVGNYYISTSDSHGREHISDPDEAEDLTREFTIPNNGIDIFLVRTFGGPDGGAAPPGGGPTNKNDDTMDGVVVSIQDAPQITATSLAHEVGHYLGLDHVDNNDTTNLMNRWVYNDGLLTAQQGQIMRSHGMVRPGC